MNLREQGYRYLVGQGPSQYGWYQPAEIALNAARFAGYTDCTDMSDEQFDAFMAAQVLPAAA